MFACDKIGNVFYAFYCKCISCLCNKDCVSKTSDLKGSMVTISHKQYTYFTQFRERSLGQILVVVK